MLVRRNAGGLTERSWSERAVAALARRNPVEMTARTRRVGSTVAPLARRRRVGLTVRNRSEGVESVATLARQDSGVRTRFVRRTIAMLVRGNLVGMTALERVVRRAAATRGGSAGASARTWSEVATSTRRGLHRALLASMASMAIGCGFHAPMAIGDDAAVDAPDACVSFSSQIDTCALAFAGELVIPSGAAIYDTDKHELTVGSVPIAVAHASMASRAGMIEVIYAQQVRLATGAQLRAIGALPLAIAAAESIAFEDSALLDVSVGGAGLQPVCSDGAVAGAAHPGGAPGGGGGGYGAAGGMGGTGDGDKGPVAGGRGGAALAKPNAPLGGCSGAKGGLGNANGNDGGAGGVGGGAIYLVAGDAIALGNAAKVLANGGGGRGGAMGDHGGGGGGAGGMIFLEAMRVEAAQATLAANGGGGGEGGQASVAGRDGQPGAADVMPAPGGTGGAPDGGAGGAGGYADNAAGQPSTEVKDGGGGGGGGSVGYIVVSSKAAAAQLGMVSPRVSDPP